MGKINRQLFEDVFGDGILDVEVKERKIMRNPTIKYVDRKKDSERRKCRNVKKKFFDEGE